MIYHESNRKGACSFVHNGQTIEIEIERITLSLKKWFIFPYLMVESILFKVSVSDPAENDKSPISPDDIYPKAYYGPEIKIEEEKEPKGMKRVFPG